MADPATIAPLLSPEELLVPSERYPALAAKGRRLLLGGITRTAARLLLEDYYDPDHVKVFDLNDDSDIPLSRHRNAWEHVMEGLPEGWTPDIVLLVSPEYNVLPLGIEASPFPLVAIIGDWNMGLRELAPCLGIFDYMVCDALGVTKLRELGYPNVHYWPFFSYDPTFHRPEFEDKRYDVTFVGNLVHTVQRERSRFLKQIASLASRRKVNIISGVYGEGYARVLQHSRIVFNRSIRGELNMRAYEAPACGALVLMESSNQEAAHLYRNGQDCVFYDEHDLIERVEYYLDHEAERDAIARSGSERARASSHSAHFSSLLTLLDRLPATPGERQFRQLPAVDQLLLLARLAYRLNNEHRYALAEDLLKRALEIAPHDPRVLADLACVYASLGEHYPDTPWPAMATECFNRALEQVPDHPLWCLNAGFFFRHTQRDRALDLLQCAVASPSADCSGAHYPFRYGHMFVEMEAAFAAHPSEPDRRKERLLELVQWQAAEWLGDLATHLSNRIEWYRTATELRPDLATTQTKLGHALLSAGATADAMVCFSRALEDNPFDLGAVKGLLEFHLQLGDFAGAEALYREYEALLSAVPSLEQQRRELGRDYDLLRTTHAAVSTLGIDPQDLKRDNYLLVVGEADWQSGLTAYLAGAPAEACLLVYNHLGNDSLHTELEALIEASGGTPESVPDILIIEAMDPEREPALFALATGVYPALPADLLPHAERAGSRFVTDFGAR